MSTCCSLEVATASPSQAAEKRKAASFGDSRAHRTHFAAYWRRLPVIRFRRWWLARDPRGFASVPRIGAVLPLNSRSNHLPAVIPTGFGSCFCQMGFGSGFVRQCTGGLCGLDLHVSVAQSAMQNYTRGDYSPEIVLRALKISGKAGPPSGGPHLRSLPAGIHPAEIVLRV
jgi:hypothetical protein